jgi:hypothetical protein
MSEPTPDDQQDPADADDLRRHAETGVEGGEASGHGAEVPREHSEDPAEG